MRFDGAREFPAKIKFIIPKAMTTTSPTPLLSSQQTIVPTGPGSGKGIDAHPYSRGSVIEVLYVKRPAKDKRIHGSNDKLLRSSEDDVDANTQSIPHYGRMIRTVKFQIGSLVTKMTTK